MSYKSITQVAEESGRGMFDIVRDIQSGKIPYVEEDGSIMIPESGLEGAVKMDMPRATTTVYDTKIESQGAEKSVSAESRELSELIVEQLADQEERCAESATADNPINDAYVEIEEAVASPTEEYFEIPTSNLTLCEVADKYAATYGRDNVNKIMDSLVTHLGEDRTRTLFSSPLHEPIFGYTPEEMEDYAQKVDNICTLLKGAYNGSLAEELDFDKNPENFMPANMYQLESKLRGIPFFQEYKSKQEAKDASSEDAVNGYSRTLVTGLQEEGLDVRYLDAMLKKSLRIGGANPFIGGKFLRRENWINNVRSALSSMGCKYDRRKIDSHVRTLTRMGLLNELDNREPCISLSSKWAVNSSKNLKEYLNHHLGK